MLPLVIALSLNFLIAISLLSIVQNCHNHLLDLQTGGPNWEVPLGRRDSTGASLSGSNNNIPAPNNTFQTILTKFKRQGLNIVDLVALSGKPITRHNITECVLLET